MKRVSVNVDYMQALVIINNVGMMINAGVNPKHQLIKVYVTKDLFGIVVTVSVNVMLVSIQTMKIISAGKNWLIN